MYLLVCGHRPTALLDLYIPQTIHKLTPWRELPDSNGRITGLQPAALSIFAKFPGGPERGTQTLATRATISYSNPLNYLRDILVRTAGLEPAWVAPPDSHSGLSAHSNTSACHALARSEDCRTFITLRAIGGYLLYAFWSVRLDSNQRIPKEGGLQPPAIAARRLTDMYQTPIYVL